MTPNNTIPVEVLESYKDYEPAFDFKAITETLLRYVPSKCLIGLDCVVLTTTSGFSRKQRRKKTRSRKRKVSIQQSLGRYHPKSANSRAWIEIFVDKQRHYDWRGARVLPMAKYMGLGKTLYHEIGHHIHYTVRPEYRERMYAMKSRATLAR